MNKAEKIQLIKEIVTYEPTTGELTWRTDRPRAHFKQQRGYTRYLKHQAGQPVKGTVNHYGYLVFGVGNLVVPFHAVAFVLMTGDFPKGVVDHWDQNKLNNAWDNLRDVTQKINTRNQKMNSRNKSGFAGVYQCSRSEKWTAQATIDRHTKNLGTFTTPEEAYQARLDYLAQHPSLGYTSLHGMK